LLGACPALSGVVHRACTAIPLVLHRACTAIPLVLHRACTAIPLVLHLACTAIPLVLHRACTACYSETVTFSFIIGRTCNNTWLGTEHNIHSGSVKQSTFHATDLSFSTAPTKQRYSVWVNVTRICTGVGRRWETNTKIWNGQLFVNWWTIAGTLSSKYYI
jgi:hypothetical protein